MSKEKELISIKKLIEEIDENLLSLLNKRLEYSINISEIKGEKEFVYRPETEVKIFNKLLSLNQGPLKEKQVNSIFREIIATCRPNQESTQVSFLGPEGTFSEAAVKENFGNEINTKPTESIEGVFRDVSEGKDSYGIVPIENSTEGSVNITLDCLSSFDLKICGEIEMSIHHSLMGSDRALPRDNFEIHAHEQTLAQCRKWLDAYCPKVKRVSVSSNAVAAKNAASKANILAIAGSLAAEQYGLEIIRSNIEDYSNNTTRFIILGHQEAEISGKDKTSLVITTKNEPGALYKVLKPINKNELNLTHIAYRPSKNDKWNYSFFLDLDRHLQDKKMVKLLKELSKIQVNIKILGSYPRAVN